MDRLILQTKDALNLVPFYESIRQTIHALNLAWGGVPGLGELYRLFPLRRAADCFRRRRRRRSCMCKRIIGWCSETGATSPPIREQQPTSLFIAAASRPPPNPADRAGGPKNQVRQIKLESRFQFSFNWQTYGIAKTLFWKGWHIGWD